LAYRAKSQILTDEETEVFMPDFAGALGASKAASALLVLFIPSKDRRNKSIDQRYWVKENEVNKYGKKHRQNCRRSWRKSGG
jgi:hypothetical protein